MSEPAPPPDPEVLAAELALGLLEGEDLAHAQARRRTDPGFEQDVVAWEHRLCGLLDAVQPVEPPVRLWTTLKLRAFDTGARDDLNRLRRSLRTWRALAGVSTGLAAVLALAVIWPHQAAEPPLLTARLSASPSGSAVFVALYDPGRRMIVLTPATLHAVTGHTPELWLIPPGAKPIAIGLADFSGSVQLPSQAGLPSLQAGALAISLEPSGGSPTGQPTGPVIATGALKRL